MVSRSPLASQRKSAPRPTGPGRPKDLGKRAAILEAAKQLFSKEGFAGVSMDKIAAEAGVSKLTVYSHFGDKEALFAAAIRAKCEEAMPGALFELELKGPLRSQLTAIAKAFFTLVSSEEAISTQRMLIGLDDSDDPLKRLFLEAGPQPTLDAFSAFLRARVEAGELEIPDVTRAAGQFFCLVKGDQHMQMICGLCHRMSRGDLAAHIDGAVDLFLRAYAVR